METLSLVYAGLEGWTIIIAVTEEALRLRFRGVLCRFRLLIPQSPTAPLQDEPENHLPYAPAFCGFLRGIRLAGAGILTEPAIRGYLQQYVGHIAMAGDFRLAVNSVLRAQLEMTRIFEKSEFRSAIGLLQCSDRGRIY